MLRFFRTRAASTRQLAVIESPALDAPATSTPRDCALASCSAGALATVVSMRCDDVQACRLRALGVCEGARVSVLDARHAMVLEVRGTRIALGKALTAGITVRPLPA